MTGRPILPVLTILLLTLSSEIARAQAPADPIGPRFRVAQDHIRAGRFAEAEPILRWILRTRPELVRVQLDHALVLFRLGRDDEAREMFLAIRRKPDLPATVRRNVEDLLEAIRRRDPLQVGFDFGLWRDDNINNAAEAETVDIPVFGTTLPFTLEERPRAAWVMRTGANLRWRERIDRRTHLEVSSAVARDTAIGHSEFNTTRLNLSVGPRIRYFVGGVGARPLLGQINFDLGVQKQMRGGEDYSTTGWLGLGADQAVAPDWRVAAQTSYWRTGFDEADAEVEPTGMSLYLGVSRRLGPGWLTVGGKFSREHTRRENRRWKGREAIVSWGATLWRDFNVTARASLGERAFDGKEALVQKQRTDDTRSLDLRLSHHAVSFEGFMPELSLGISRTESSVVLYERSTRTARLGMRRLF